MASRTLEIVVNQTGNAASGIASLSSGILGIGAIVGGTALAGIAALGAGIYAVGNAGLSMNNSMEQATAKINAFTKDAAVTADILEDVREEAANTPFEFEAMANAVSGLLPAARQADVAIMDLLRDAEVLAASNPAEGLEGAAFALREAVSGDFTSVIERFNLPRSMINQLKEEGLPALEIVRQAMNAMGYDMDLVSALAATAEGRWSTLKDAFTNFASTITQPVFDAFSAGLGRVNEMLAANEPAIARISTAISGVLGAAMTALKPSLEGLLQQFQAWVTDITPQVVGALTVMQTQFGAWAAYLGTTVIPAVVQMAGSFIENAIKAIPSIVQALTQLYQFTTSSLMPAFTSIWDSLRRIVAVFTEGKSSTDLLGGAIRVLEMIMLPTIQAIQGIAMAFEVVAFVVETVNQAVKDIGAVFNALKGIWDQVWGGMKMGLDVVIGAWQAFKDIVSSVVNVIPNILMPGSPTPFEMGLRGIADATKQVSREMSGAFDGTAGFAPALAAGGASPGVAYSGGGIGATSQAPVTIHLTYSPAVSLATEHELEEALDTAWKNLARKNGVTTSG